MAIDGVNYGVSYSYNSDGIRTGRTTDIWSGATTYSYVLDGSKIIKEKRSDGTILYYTYDTSGSLVGFKYNRSNYYYVKNIQGDIIKIINSSGAEVVSYTYDAYGKILGISGSLASTVGQINPFRYRGYYYDVGTGLYWLQSRYYDPTVGRFINADNVLPQPGNDVRGYNMYAYCLNNPVNMSDESGHWPQWIKNVAKAVGSVVTQVKAVLSIPSTVAKIAVASTVAVVSGKATVSDVVNDAKNYSFFNKDETKVLDSKVFSSYKGTPVLKHEISGVTSFSISNTIVFNRSETVGNGGIDTVKHEWGHTVQQSLMGTPKFVSRIAVPSVISCVINPSSKTYYSLPWERTADFFGGTSRSSGYHNGSDVWAGLYFIMP